MSYVLAVIRLPLEVNPDGTFTALNENIDFEFIPVKELPLKKENGMKLASLELDAILGLFTTSGIRKKDETTLPTINDIQSESMKKVFIPNNNNMIIIDKKYKRIRNKNTTFKNHVSSITKNYHNYTTKCWK
jgi:hypothetical protein